MRQQQPAAEFFSEKKKKTPEKARPVKDSDGRGGRLSCDRMKCKNPRNALAVVLPTLV